MLPMLGKGKIHMTKQNREAIHKLFVSKKYLELYQQKPEILNDMLLIESQEELEDLLCSEDEIEEDIFWLYAANRERENLRIDGYEGDVTKQVFHFLQTKLPDSIFSMLSNTVVDLYVDLGTRDTLQDRVSACNKILESYGYHIQLDFEDTYCAGTYFLQIVPCKTLI